MEKVSIFITLLVFNLANTSIASAPDDITNNRLWLDGIDIDADNDYTDNPAGGAQVTQWLDKSPNGYTAGEALSFNPAQRAFPTYSTNNGVSYDGFGDVLEITGGIYNNQAVSAGDYFLVATTDTRQVSFVFLSGPPRNQGNRISAHIPWSNNIIYWDFVCCGAGRETASWPGTGSVFGQRYVWNFRSEVGTGQDLARNGASLASDGSATTYTEQADHNFYIGGGEGRAIDSHDGIISEFLVYDQQLNSAERLITHNYLNAKWSVALTALDQYLGDTPANGDFDFFVGGIGEEADGNLTLGTSAGLTVNDAGFLADNGDYIIAGINSLQPATGTTTSDIPATVTKRSTREWYLDITDVNSNNGNVNLTFDLTELAVPFVSGQNFQVVYRSISTGTYALIGSPVSAASSNVQFSLNNISDGYYAIAAFPVADLSITKSDATTTYTPGATSTYIITVTNNGPDDVSNVLINDNLPNGVTLTGTWSCSATAGSSCSSATGGSAGDNLVNLTATILNTGIITVSVPVQFSSNMADY